MEEVALQEWVDARCGFSAQVRTVYESLRENFDKPGKTGASAVSVQTGIARSVVYRHLAWLEDNDFIKSVIDGAVRTLEVMPVTSPSAAQRGKGSNKGISIHALRVLKLENAQGVGWPAELSEADDLLIYDCIPADTLAGQRRNHLYRQLLSVEQFHYYELGECADHTTKADLRALEETGLLLDCSYYGAYVVCPPLTVPVSESVWEDWVESCQYQARLAMSRRETDIEKLLKLYHAIRKDLKILVDGNEKAERSDAILLCKDNSYAELRGQLVFFMYRPKFFSESPVIRSAVEKYGPSLRTFRYHLPAIAEGCRAERLVHRNSPETYWTRLLRGPMEKFIDG
jgi:hypothetical protein